MHPPTPDDPPTAVPASGIMPKVFVALFFLQFVNGVSSQIANRQFHNEQRGRWEREDANQRETRALLEQQGRR